MDRSSLSHEIALYQQALQFTMPSERGAFLLMPCAGDDPLLGRLRQQLASEAEATARAFLPTVVSPPHQRGRPAVNKAGQAGASLGACKFREQVSGSQAPSPAVR